MRKSNSGLTLIELILTLAIAAMVIPIGYSLLFVGNDMFNVSAGRGFSQQNVRLLSDYIKDELHYASHISDNTDAFHTQYYSIEYDDTLNKFIKKHYVYNDTTDTVVETIVQTINGEWDVLNISNITPGTLDVNLGHEEIIGNKTSRFDLPFRINLQNATSLETSLSMDLTAKISGQPVRLYYMNAKDSLYNVSIEITDLDLGGSDGAIGTRIITFDSNTGTGSIASIVRNINTDITLPSGGGLSKAGFKFVRWNTKADGTGNIYEPNSIFKVPSDNVTLYAIWQINSTVINNVSLGEVVSIGGRTPVSGPHGFKVTSGTNTTIRINLNGYTSDHKDKVQVSTTTDSTAYVFLISQIQREALGYYIDITIDPPDKKNTNFTIKLNSLTQGYAMTLREYSFRTSD